ncbi:hypothetical protein Q9R29_08535 [Rothia sp. ARF10]|nr:hypothetical protein [Rothia sp. ARF10]
MGPGRVQSAVRAAVQPGNSLPTPTRRGQFSVAEYTAEAAVLLLGTKQTRTPLPWAAFEEAPGFLRGRGWVRIGGGYETVGDPETLDGFLKGYFLRATAGWVAVVLERAGVVEVDRASPARVRLRPEW